MSGHIILINGTSSAGKTTLAKAIQRLASATYQIITLDQFRDGMPDRFRGLNSPKNSPGSRGLNVEGMSTNGAMRTKIVFGDIGQRVLQGMRRAVVAVADLDINVIVDDMINLRSSVEDYEKVFRDYATTFVGLHCGIEELIRRENMREGRFPGTAETQLETVHRWMKYDIEVDTTSTSPDANAVRVLEFIATTRQAQSL